MPTDLIGALMGKFEKNELYTFLTGCAVSLALLTAVVDMGLMNADMPMVIFRFAFLFILSTAIVYAIYSVVIYLLFFIYRISLSEKTALGKWCIKRYGKQDYLYLPAYAQLQVARHILLLITVGLMLMAPWMCDLIQRYGFSEKGIWIYIIIICILTLLSIRASFYEYIYDLCVRNRAMFVTNNQAEYIAWLNTDKSQ